MAKQQNFKLFFAIVLMGIFLFGAYTLLRPPANKPMPEAPAPAAPQPIAGVPEFNANKYRAEPTISVYIAERGSVESMPLETYLEGVIAKEMDASWPIEALAAQAITSRTLTVHAMEAGTIQKLHHADVSTAKEELQAYAPNLVNQNVKMAVEKTRGQVLLYAGSLVNAIYSASNGQISATKEEAFPKEIIGDTPYFQAVADESFQYTPAAMQNWTVKIPAMEVAQAIGYNGNPGDISILEKGPSGRILYIGAGDKKIYGSEFRKLVGFDRLKSTLISELTYDGSQFIFQGHGWGNGVGLCQWGAYTYAEQGMSAQEIIKHYYIGAEIQKIYQ